MNEIRTQGDLKVFVDLVYKTLEQGKPVSMSTRQIVRDFIQELKQQTNFYHPEIDLL